MNGASEQLFAGPALSGDQHGTVELGCAASDLERGAQGVRLTDDVGAVAGAPGLDGVLDRRVAGTIEQVFSARRLDRNALGAKAHGLGEAFGLTWMTQTHDHVPLRSQLFNLLQPVLLVEIDRHRCSFVRQRSIKGTSMNDLANRAYKLLVAVTPDSHRFAPGPLSSIAASVAVIPTCVPAF
jgi:hypothetical protein